AVSGYLAQSGCNINDSSQFIDEDKGRFFMRLRFVSERGQTLESLAGGFPPVANEFGMEYEIHDLSHKTKVVIMVSRFGHCLNDLLYRSRIGSLPIEIAAVISNHGDYQKQVVSHDIPFRLIRVTPETKPEAEAAIMRVVQEAGAELIVLARYMQ
ncbi:formyltransferase family protein, partial [Brucella grignonensis]